MATGAAAMFGIDVSHWQGNFNFAKAKSEGVQFVIIKSGGGDSGLYKDGKFEQFYKEARNNGLYVGAYYFGAAKTEERSLQEANSFLAQLSGKQFEMGVYYDVEAGMLQLDKNLLTRIIITFCDRVKTVYPNVGIYSSSSAFNNRMNDVMLSKYIHWVAQWSNSKPKLRSGNETAIWQFGGTTNTIRSNKIAGVVCDQDFCYMDISSNTIKPVDNSATENQAPAKKSIDELVQEILDGKWGNGTERKKKLIAAGYDYSVVQNAVNKAVADRDKTKEVDKTIDELAREVIAGKWGNGAARKRALTEAGYDYNKVQARVNELIKKR